MATDVHSAVGLLTAGDLTTYDVRSCTRAESADNKAYVSSQTAGKTFRKPGNRDATWEISLYCKSGDKDMPAALKADQIINIQIPTGANTERMIIDSSSLEVNIESGDLLGISLSCSAVDAVSYP